MTVRSKELERSINRVEAKLTTLLNEGADFKMTRWRFDWSEKLNVVDNIKKCVGELQALNYLQNLGIIKIKSKINLNDHFSDVKYNQITGRDVIWKPGTDRAAQHYQTAVWIIKFDHSRFNKWLDSRGSQSKTKVSFTLNSLALVVEGKTIKLGPKETVVCSIIFANKSSRRKKWLFDELLEEKGELLRQQDILETRQLQSVKTRLNQKIAAETPSNLRDVFIGNGSIGLNPNYLD